MELDAQLTFDSFVVGPANRLASAASRRAAESPGRSFNPLFIYSSSGLGKSHLLHAIAHQAEEGHSEVRVLYKTLEQYMDDLERALERGERDVLREAYRDLDILLLDDVQFITGHTEAQEMLLGTLDALAASGSQVVLASDRPPAEIDDLDARLLSRFSGGLIVDIAMPEFETRVAIIKKKVAARAAELAEGVAQAVARFPYENVREIQGALNRILAVQEIEERQVGAEEVGTLLGPDGGSGKGGEFSLFVDELSATVASTVSGDTAWRKPLEAAVSEAEAEGFNASRLAKVLKGSSAPESPEEIVATFQAELARLKDVRAELDRIGNPWPEAAGELLSNPDRLKEAEALLASARERRRPFPSVPPGPDLKDLAGRFTPLALRVAEQLVTEERPEYNPLYVWNQNPEEGLAVQLAAARTARNHGRGSGIAVISVDEFAEEFIEALSTGVAGAWRERWWAAELLLLHGIEKLSETERAQEELFHLFEALKRSGARIFLSAACPPSGIDAISERLQSRFEGGLVLELELVEGARSLEELQTAAAAPVAQLGWASAHSPTEDEGAAAAVASGPGPAPGAPLGDWMPTPESVLWEWPRIEDRVTEELG